MVPIWMRSLRVLCLAGACFAASVAAAAVPGDDPHIQVFSALNEKVAAVGEQLMLEVKVYASIPAGAAADRIVARVGSAGFATAAQGLTVVRSTTTRRFSYKNGSADPVLVVERRFILWARQAGRVVVPPLRLELEAAAYQTEAHLLYAYQARPSFFEVESSIFPIVAEVPGLRPGRTLRRTGTAFLVAPDAVVTSYHVVSDAQRILLTLPNGKRVVLKKAWVIDPVRDVALLYIDPRATQKAGLKALSFAASQPYRPGHALMPDEAVVFTYGWPGGMQRSTAGMQHHGVSLGQGAIWVSANPVRPGDSGGPLIDAKGHVLGVISAGAVLQQQRDVLREEVCIATDPRPALGQRLLVERPRSLRSIFRDPGFNGQPHVQAQRVSAVLSAGRRNIPQLAARLDALDAALDAEGGRDAGLSFIRGVIHQMTGMAADAAAAYEETLARFEGHFPAAYMLALHHLRNRSYRRAAQMFEYTAQFQPYAHLAAYGLAQAEMGRLHYEAAQTHLKAVLRYDPHFAPALLHLAECHLALGDEARARQLLVPLTALDARRAERLRQLLRYDLLRRPVLRELPRASL